MWSSPPNQSFQRGLMTPPSSSASPLPYFNQADVQGAEALLHLRYGSTMARELVGTTKFPSHEQGTSQSFEHATLSTESISLRDLSSSPSPPSRVPLTHGASEHHENISEMQQPSLESIFEFKAHATHAKPPKIHNTPLPPVPQQAQTSLPDLHFAKTDLYNSQCGGGQIFAALRGYGRIVASNENREYVVELGRRVEMDSTDQAWYKARFGDVESGEEDGEVRWGWDGEDESGRY